MGLSLFARLLTTERFRRRASAHVNEGFAVPQLYEFNLGPEDEPLLVTNARGGFLPTRRSRTGLARCGFSQIPLETEVELYQTLYSSLLQGAASRGWPKVCATVPEGIAAMEQAGGKACSVVVPYDFAQQMCGLGEAQVRERMSKAGVVARVGLTQVLALDIPAGTGLVTEAPSKLGVYVRVDDWLGLLFKSLSSSLVVIHGVAG